MAYFFTAESGQKKAKPGRRVILTPFENLNWTEDWACSSITDPKLYIMNYGSEKVIFEAVFATKDYYDPQTLSPLKTPNHSFFIFLP